MIRFVQDMHTGGQCRGSVVSAMRTRASSQAKWWQCVYPGMTHAAISMCPCVTRVCLLVVHRVYARLSCLAFDKWGTTLRTAPVLCHNTAQVWYVNGATQMRGLCHGAHAPCVAAA